MATGEPPPIQMMFSDLTQGLRTVSADEWTAIPDIGEMGSKARKKVETFTPMSDAVLQSGLTGGTGTAVVDGADTVLDLNKIGEARGTVLGVKLDQMSDSVSGQTNIDPKGYLTSLASVRVSSSTEVAELKNARLLLKSLTSTNSGHAPGWIAAARLEEVAGKLPLARKIIEEGCENCPDSEDVWVESARLQTPENAKLVVAQAVKRLPQSVAIWVCAIDLETDTAAKRKVVRKALEAVPQSVRLWMTAVELESEDNARVLLGRAVECVPTSIDLWLALARLETYANAKAVLNRARQALPTEPAVWIAGAQLEEANGSLEMVPKIVAKAVKSLAALKAVVDRDFWLKSAETCERQGSPHVCRAIVASALDLGVEERDREATWVLDAEEAAGRGAIETARAIYSATLAAYPRNEDTWLKALHLEIQHHRGPAGGKGGSDALFERATKACPEAEVFWLMWAKHAWSAEGRVDDAREILARACAALPVSEDLWLARLKVEAESGNHAAARSVLEHARRHASTARVWLKAALLERQAGDAQAERGILEEGIALHPHAEKLHLMLGQLELRAGNRQAALAAYARGIKASPKCAALWLCKAEAEASVSARRATLETARTKLPGNDALWRAAVHAEVAAGNLKAAQQLLAKALQDCPKSGLLWSETIEMEPLATRRQQAIKACKAVENDARVVATVGRLFAFERKLDRAASWFARAVTLDPDYGDAWAAWYAFSLAHPGTDALTDPEAIIAKCVAAGPRHGELWVKVSKDPARGSLSTAEILKAVSASIPEVGHLYASLVH